MKITRRSTLPQVAGVVGGALKRAGIHAVLTGGACATFYSGGAYQSHDLDFVVRGGVTRQSLDDAMSSAGFARAGDHYVHPNTAFFVEFPAGPLGIGADLDITPVVLRVGQIEVLGLSASDSCRDRLAAFYHWSDRQSLEVALEIARRQHVNLAAIKRWSEREGHLAEFNEFRNELKRKS